VGSQPQVSSLTDFQKSTSGGMFRGREEMEDIDFALSHWQEYATSMTPADRMLFLSAAIEACQQWQTTKRNKKDTASTSLLRKRWAAVEKLLIEFTDAYRFESFRANKNIGRVDQKRGMELKGMSGNYIFEATAQPKGVAHPSASHVMHYAKEKGKNITSKESYTKVRDEYVADPKRGNPLEQIYYDRAERIRFLLVPKKGKLYKDPTTPADFRGAWAMDEYGNLFAQEVPDDPRAFNHSSFCRGKQVVCAGIIDIDMGTLKSIDNMSGHYKPGPNQMANALRILMGNGVDLSKTNVMCALGPGRDSDRTHCGTHNDLNKCRAADVETGAFMKVILSPAAGFLGNPSGNGLPIADPKTFKSSAEVKTWAAMAHLEFNHVG
jgi:hypothetical protein